MKKNYAKRFYSSDVHMQKWVIRDKTEKIGEYRRSKSVCRIKEQRQSTQYTKTTVLIINLTPHIIIEVFTDFLTFV
jgi:hypothetical protein